MYLHYILTSIFCCYLWVSSSLTFCGMPKFPGLTMISWARWTSPWSQPTKRPWCWTWTPGRTTSSNLGYIFFGVSWQTNMSKKNQGNKWCQPKKHQKWQNTQFKCLESEEFLGGALFCFILRRNFIVENCSHGLYHGGAILDYVWSVSLEFGGKCFLKNIWHFRYLEVCVSLIKSKP